MWGSGLKKLYTVINSFVLIVTGVFRLDLKKYIYCLYVYHKAAEGRYPEWFLVHIIDISTCLLHAKLAYASYDWGCFVKFYAQHH